MNEIEQALYDYIKEEFAIDDDPDFTAEVNLFDSGFVDSMGAFMIITFAEDRWSIEISQRDLTLYPMNTIQEIAAVIAGKL